MKEVLVPGPRYGMANIAAAVRGGRLVFLSGIRGVVDQRDGRAVAEERPDAFAEQTSVVYGVIASDPSRLRTHDPLDPAHRFLAS